MNAAADGAFALDKIKQLYNRTKPHKPTSTSQHNKGPSYNCHFNITAKYYVTTCYTYERKLTTTSL